MFVKIRTGKVNSFYSQTLVRYSTISRGPPFFMRPAVKGKGTNIKIEKQAYLQKTFCLKKNILRNTEREIAYWF